MSAAVKYIGFITIAASINFIIGCNKDHNTALNQQNNFQKTYGRTDRDFVTAIKQTSDKGYIMAWPLTGQQMAVTGHLPIKGSMNN